MTIKQEIVFGLLKEAKITNDEAAKLLETEKEYVFVAIPQSAYYIPPPIPNYMPIPYYPTMCNAAAPATNFQLTFKS